MKSSPFPVFGGATELTAEMLNLMLEQMRRQSRLVSAYPVLVHQTSEGWQVRLSGVKGLWAVAGAHEGGGRYAWTEAQLTPNGWRERPGGRGGSGTGAAFESAGRTDVTPGSVLWITVEEFGRATFVAPLGPRPTPAWVWARIDDEADGWYGWTEMTFTGGVFEELTDGRVVEVTEEDGDAAREANDRATPVGSLVVLVRSGDTWFFEYGGVDPGFWAVLLRERKGAVYEADLGGATGGTWALTFEPGPNPAPGTGAGTVQLAAAATAAEVADAVESFTRGDVAVAGGAGAYTFTFGGNLNGASGASLSASGGGLEGASEFAFEQTAVARDLPYTDGAGGYAWVRAAFDVFGRLRPDPDAGGSVWPTGLALEANALRVVPEGGVAWVRPRTAGAVLRATAEENPAFADWSGDELDAHFESVDAGDGTLADDGVDFAWWGGDSFWGELTGDPDAAGLYPFRVVHLGGLDPADEPAEAPAAMPTAAALRIEYLAGDVGATDTFEVPLSESDRAWVPSRPGGREITGTAREIVGRTGFPTGTVVRVYATPGADGATDFTFSGPPLSFWATLGDAVEGAADAGTYAWTELDPPADPTTGEVREARTGEATEVAGVEGLAAESTVYLYPDGAGGWRFRADPDTPEGGRDCRLLLWEGGDTATIVAGPDDPDADGTEVDVRFLPERDAADLVRAGHHVGYRATGKDYYVVPVPFEYASDRTAGYLTTGPQGIAHLLTIQHGALVVTGSGTTPPFDPPLAYRADNLTSTYTLHTPGYAALPATGALHMSDGPRLVAAGGMLDLQGGVYCTTPAVATRTDHQTSLIQYPKDGPTGTFAIPGVGGAAGGSITFDGGLFVSAVAPAARPAMFSGTFLMYDTSIAANRTVTVHHGVITQIV